jgi:hypothetical protein
LLLRRLLLPVACRRSKHLVLLKLLLLLLLVSWWMTLPKGPVGWQLTSRLLLLGDQRLCCWHGL